MCDPYLKYKVGTKADIWMLGCILFAMTFYKHPFDESTALSICNATYYLPEKHKYSKKLENLIRNILTPNPANRYSIQELCSVLEKFDSLSKIELNVIFFYF